MPTRRHDRPMNQRLALESLRLPELQAKYKEVTGNTTRCPNRTWLINEITKARAAARRRRIPTHSPSSEESSEAEHEVETAPDTAPELPAEAPQQNSRVEDTAPPPDPQEGFPEAPTAKRRGRFRDLSVDDLRAKYVETVGRPTKSTDRRYLEVAIRAAERGRIPIGPLATRQAGGSDDEHDVQVIPLRIPRTTAAAMDSAWRSANLKTRAEFFRRAIRHYLLHLRAYDAAELFPES